MTYTCEKGIVGLDPSILIPSPVPFTPQNTAPSLCEIAQIPRIESQKSLFFFFTFFEICWTAIVQSPKFSPVNMFLLDTLSRCQCKMASVKYSGTKKKRRCFPQMYL